MILTKGGKTMNRKIRQDYDSRYDEYLAILSENPIYRQAFDNTCKEFLMEKGLQMPLDSRLYLMVFAPILVEFVSWVMEQALAAGKNRLYFLSRDGYQMYLTARRLAAYKNIPVECRYLHVSRYSMRIPGYHLDMESCMDSICVGGIDVTLLKILRRGALTEEESRIVIGELKLEEVQDRILNYCQIVQLKKRLAASGRLRQYIWKHSMEAYDNAIGYLKQEGLCRDADFAIVDSGWIGTLQCSIETLVQSVNPDIKVEGCYFGMYEYPERAGRERFHTYYFSPRHGAARKICFSNSLFETIVSSDEGMTMAYGEENGKYFPVLAERDNLNAEQLRRNAAALERYLKHLESADKSYGSKGSGQRAEKCEPVSGQTVQRTGKCEPASGQSGRRPEKRESVSETIRPENGDFRPVKTGRELAEKLLKRFMSRPTTLEYECYGKDLFSDDVLDECQKEAAAELTRKQIRDQRFFSKLLIMGGLKRAAIYESAWLEGSAFGAFGAGRKLSAELRHIRFYKGFVYLKKLCCSRRQKV